ncbi:phage major capsid protein [Microbulbifer salipaludis]|uniref:Phage major capsid protein n=1 Tax=Microbulbifer salipaludis TaxID=187980 RepID=A0ABS3E954_9GAMM|nr:phage major capsid protein [Microbulbifer salipaludis]MBN8431814.1 phage major capsid protein [Microbulbifer salipaludis]
MSKLLDLQQKRGQLAASMRNLVDSVDSAKGMTTDQETQWSKMNDDLVALDKQIAQLEKMEEIEARMSEVPDPANRPAPEGSAPINKLGTDEYVGSYEQYVRAGMNTDIRAALTVGTDSEGGYTVPESWSNMLIQSLADNVVMRSICTVIGTGEDRNLPLVADNGAAGWVGEGGPYPESDPAFAGAILKAWKLGRITKVSEELLQDSAVNVEAEIARIFGVTFGTAEEAGFIVGDGIDKPTGVTVTGQVGKTAASATAITYDEIVDLIHSVRAVYRSNGSFLVKDATMGMLRKLKSTDGIPLWQPSVAAGAPDTFLGHKVYTSEAMPAVATGNKSIAFGDFKQYYIADRGGIVMQRLNEKYADTGHVGFRMRKRVDGKLLVAEAVKTLQQA